mgnify:CR=1 FL=1
MTDVELTKLREKLLRKPNPFEWGNVNIKDRKWMVEYIMENPYQCDDCGDTYNKNDLIKYGNEHICPNCIDELWLRDSQKCAG